MTHHPWSKLQSALYRIIDPEVGFQMHCCAYSIGESIPIPRYWITIEKKIVWDFPKNAMWDEGQWYFGDETKALSCLIRAYVNCPNNELLSYEFKDRWKMLPFLRVCDKRIGKRRLEKMLKKEEYAHVAWIIRKRLKIPFD